MHIPANSSSMFAARNIVATAQRSDDPSRLGLADAVDLNTCTLTREELIELIAALAATIEKLATASDYVLQEIVWAIIDDAK